MVIHITNMEDGGQFGGRSALIVWFSQKLHFFHKNGLFGYRLLLKTETLLLKTL